ncbi:serine/threonine-protein kinase [Oerskovia flava]|uniref:serine/threonine-protein kinase n=1 Tax=Oerskovia flava TaxID=2986422 RepID=UPI00223FF850|nr:serine/threonine-protein kinase [Oerskovia sp. JB1-3-2]
MSSKRAPSAPPLIKGFEYVSLIGSGGFSDVFLYQQQRPRRRVAVKVLLHEWSGEAQRAAFDAEADLMATLSTHPSIVTMYEADVADDGRPYLAMEYCSRPNLGARYRAERFSVAEALRVAVQIAGAVETAHQLGIVHRDIKPANILVTEYGHPVLTDFGISATLADATRAEGMSIPWSPPESFGDPPQSGLPTDIWALAATTYTLLAGRTPFEVPGGSNSSASLMSRIEQAPLARIGRSDVPASLERTLGTAMAKAPGSRYPTMLAFARALQQVQTELSLAVTPIDVVDGSGQVHVEEPDDDGGTRLRQVVAIDPRGARPAAPATGPSGTTPYAAGTGTGTSGAVAPAGTSPTSDLGPVPLPQHTPAGYAQQASAQEAPPVAPVRTPPPVVAPAPRWGTAPVEDTVHRTPDVVGAPTPGEEAPTRRRALWPAIVAAVVLVGVGIGGYAVLDASDGSDPRPTGTASSTAGGTSTDGSPGEDDAGSGAGSGESTPQDNLGALVPSVTDLDGTYDADTDEVTFTWESPSHEEGDTYRWRRLSAGSAGPWEPADLDAVVPVEGPETCVEVTLVRDGRASAYPKQTCVRTESE